MSNHHPQSLTPQWKKPWGMCTLPSANNLLCFTINYRLDNTPFWLPALLAGVSASPK